MVKKSYVFSLRDSDFQKRGPNYPKEGIPDYIEVYESLGGEYCDVEFVFKNTDETQAEKWVKSYLKTKKIVIDSIWSEQIGDYENDWVSVTARVKVEE